MTAGSDPFPGLDFEVADWAGFTHAYGSAADVPALIRLLVSPDADVRSAALGELFGSIFHQGTVCSASAPAIPFLARAAVMAPGQRERIILLMAGMCRQYGEDWSDPSTFSGAVRAAVASVLGELAPLLADPDPGVRRAMLRIAAVCPSLVVRDVCDLREFADPDERVRADALLALARAEHDWPGLRLRLQDCLRGGSPAVRQAAALTVLSLDGLPFPPGPVTILADSLGAVGDLWAEPGDETWDQLPGASLPDPYADAVPAGRDALGVLTTLSLDRDAALGAAARIVAARTRHAVQGAYLASTVFDRWRDTHGPVAAVTAQFLATAADIRYPSADLRLLARCATRIGDPDPELTAAALPWADNDDHRIASAAVGALARLRDHRCIDLAGRAVEHGKLLGPDLVTVCETHGEQAAELLPRLRQQLTGMPAEPLRDRLNDPHRYVLQALPLSAPRRSRPSPTCSASSKQAQACGRHSKP
jgi:HEAT repeat protein